MNDKRAVLPAEWEPQSGVMLTWPHAGTDWAPYLEEINETYLQMAEAIVRRERLLVVTPHAEEIAAMLSKRIGETLMKNVGNRANGLSLHYPPMTPGHEIMVS